MKKPRYTGSQIEAILTEADAAVGGQIFSIAVARFNIYAFVIHITYFGTQLLG